MSSFTNQLIHETSPYLLQHAHNPVNWFPWGDKALQKAKEENKPILVSIGYAACHWCHVMEKESFEDEITAALMNENFINIKVDREERPDLDHIYMDAVQAMTGSGGWPLNVFLTPEAKPFYGGTYFPPQKAFNRPSWQEVLQGVIHAFTEKRNEIEAQAENLTGHLQESNTFGLQSHPEADAIFTMEKVEEAFANIVKMADKEWGGFGKAPKFPQTFSIQFLLRYRYIKNKSSERGLLQTNEAWGRANQALLSLDKMIEGGIYDQIGGGFARYATDTEWLAPHFEKMLYDNALLISVLSEAYQLTAKERYKEVIDETMEFIQRELLHEHKGFYAALDADSEGIEGKFYVWTKDEIQQILKQDANIFCEYYDITSNGNWEHTNILRVKEPIEQFATKRDIKATAVKEIIEKGKKELLTARSKRVRPLLDDKIILSWNALMNTACCKAFAATGKEAYRQLAIENMDFLLKNFKTQDKNKFHHTWKNGQAKYPAFLDDYAFLIQALINLQEITGNTDWLSEAKLITEFVIDNFSEPETGYFFYTIKDQKDVIIRKKEVYDGAIPSGNSVMAYNLYHLAVFFDKNEWKQRSISMVYSLSTAIIKYPVSFANWACLLQEITAGTSEIVITGKNLSEIHNAILKKYLPHRVLMISDKINPGFPLLVDKYYYEQPLAWLCRDFKCFPPVTTVNELMLLIDSQLSVN